jgi:hypothetical protein
MYSHTTCPSCGSNDVRSSRSGSRWQFLLEWRNLHRFRCRECRRSFAAPLPAAEREALQKSEQIRRKRSQGWKSSTQSRTRRRIVEVVLFLGMFLLFYLAFNLLVGKDGSSIFSRPASSTQP